MPRGKRAYRVLLWAVLAALLALATFAGWRLWRVYGDAARAAQLAREMQQTAVPAAGESAAGTDAIFCRKKAIIKNSSAVRIRVLPGATLILKIMENMRFLI